MQLKRKYKNTKTGAVIYSSSPISGGNWVEVDENETEGIKQKTIEKTDEPKTEYVEEEIDLEQMTKTNSLNLRKNMESKSMKRTQKR